MELNQHKGKRNLHKHGLNGNESRRRRCQTCTDDAERGELLSQSLHVGVTVRVELPARDAQVEAQPGGVSVAAAVPPDVLVALLTGTYPGEGGGGGGGEVILLLSFTNHSSTAHEITLKK